MYAAWYDVSGPARAVQRTGHLPTPAPHEGEVLVQVKASGINPSDYKRRGAARVPPQPGVRTVPHSDGSGVVVEVGTATGPAVDENQDRPPDRTAGRVPDRRVTRTSNLPIAHGSAA